MTPDELRAWIAVMRDGGARHIRLALSDGSAVEIELGAAAGAAAHPTPDHATAVPVDGQELDRREMLADLARDAMGLSDVPVEHE